MFRKAMLGDTALLSLDFTAGTVPTAVTFTRADSTARATFIDSSGYVKTVAAAGDARFDYTGGVAKGLLIEASAINELQRSNEFNTSPWYVLNLNTPSVASPAVTDPSGGTNTWYFVPSGAGAVFHGLRFNTTFTAVAYTFSIWAKAVQHDKFLISDLSSGQGSCRFDLTAKTATVITGIVTPTNPQIIEYPNGWFRCSFTMVMTASARGIAYTSYPSGATLGAFGASFTATGTDGMYFYGAQTEIGSSASSYIPTGASALTRLADDAVIRSTAWTSLYAQPGAMVVEFYRGAYGAGDRSIMSTDTTAARHWHLKQANASATAQIAFSTGSPVTQTGLVSGLNKVAIAWNAPTPTASFDLCVNGATPTFGGSNVGTTLSTWLTLGSQSTTGVSGTGVWDGYLNNSIKSVKYYSGLTYAEMQAKTT